MKKALKEYSDALEAHLEAQRQEAVAKDHLKKTRHTLLIAREQMRLLEQEVLEDMYLKLI